MMDRWPEYALMDMMNRQGLHHAYITYEKDKHWTIWRLGAKQAGFFDKIINRAYLRALPLLLRSRLFRQHTYSNTTTNVSVDEMRAYLWQHLDIHPKRWG
jgi:hypothetical protein